MRRAALLSTLIVLALAGCGSAGEGDTPDACLSGPGYYSRALEQSVDTVRFSDDPLISECLVRNQSAGDLTTVGGYLVQVATQLNEKARRDPGGALTVRLGFLVGAVARGASDTGGAHSELVRRVEAAALYSPAGKPPPQPFDHTYRTGYAAGRERG